ncbi:hypothetical protein ACFT9I_20165 [Streptomyces sp. NPDC057137]|uniref:hypothetical protein n=1 Tax=Streptomyces sp. NPDC057137 TaxID=3346030 RepID=UPI0036253FF8
MTHHYTAAELSPPETYFQTAGFCLLVAVVLIWIGRTQRRTGRGVFSPDKSVRVGDALVAESPPSKGKRMAGRVYLVIGWFVLLGAVVNLVNGFRAA